MLTAKFNALQTSGLLRERYLIEERDSIHISINGKALINFCSNDYLDLATHPSVKKAFIAGINKYGLGSGASAAVSGYTRSHQQLEEEFAEHTQRERAILFNSGYHANLGVLTTFSNRNTTIIADKFCHASLLDGAQLSRAHLHRYRHLDYQHAEELLTHSANANTLLMTESVFSMEGSIAPLPKLAAVAKKHHTMLILDDAHGIGIMGANGAGACAAFGLTENDIPCLITPLGKAIGSYGALVSGKHDIIETLLQFARTYRYSTALPPALCDATIVALRIANSENWRRQKLDSLARLFNQEVKKRELHLASTDITPIKSIIVGDNKLALSIQHSLLAQGFFVSCIRPPTVAKNTARIRVSLNCMHDEACLIHLLDCLCEALKRGRHND